MNFRILFQRNLNFGKRLIRLHHLNAMLFLVISATGFILFSTTFRSIFPAIRVLIRDIHIWIGVILCLPLLFYLPKMKRHLKTLQKKETNRYNLFFILTILTLLIVSGFFLTFHRQFSPIVSFLSLFIHDIATWIGVPYVIYHSITRSKWFRQLIDGKQPEERLLEPIIIDNLNPIYKRRSFIKLLSGGLIALAFIPAFIKWVKPFLPVSEETTGSITDGNQLTPLPLPRPNSAPPIGGGKKGDFRYYTVTEVPNLTNENWTFTIDGLVEQKKQFSWSEFVQLKRDVQVSDFHCVTGWSVFNITWEGIPLKKLLDNSELKKEAKYVKFYSADGVYTDTLSLKQAMQTDIMVAMLLDGELINQQNGGPVRLIVPKMYAYKSVKWLNRIELVKDDHIGYWEQRGYSKDAWVKT
ncbi:MAG TPA: molybdopterin-dependent oxidoreductase [Neobacillus sp.]|jgi:DMSO/TMAO reductase YedYZ molybdopterin-dependent catalytic subunit